MRIFLYVFFCRSDGGDRKRGGGEGDNKKTIMRKR